MQFSMTSIKTAIKTSIKQKLLKVIQFHCQRQELNTQQSELLPQKTEPEEEFTEQQSLANQ